MVHLAYKNPHKTKIGIERQQTYIVYMHVQQAHSIERYTAIDLEKERQEAGEKRTIEKRTAYRIIRAQHTATRH